MFEIPRRGRQAGNVRTNVPKILDLKSSSEQMFPKIDVGLLVPLTHCSVAKTYPAGRDRINPPIFNILPPIKQLLIMKCT